MASPITMQQPVRLLPPWIDDFVTAIGAENLNEGDLGVAVFSLIAGALVVLATIAGVLYAHRQFRIANTIKYLEEFRLPATKRIVDKARRGDRRNGCRWRVYGLMTGVRQLRFRRSSGEVVTIAVPQSRKRSRFARRAKYLSNYFDYAAVLIKKGHIDADLFFKQLCDVVIDNWRLLQPYIYYQRLARLDPFAFEHLDYFEAALAALRAAPELDKEAIVYLTQLIACAHDLAGRRYSADNSRSFRAGLSRALRRGWVPHAISYRSGFWRTMAPEVRARRAAYDSQIWFEWLCRKAIKWRNRRRRLRDWFAPDDQIELSILRIGAAGKPAG